MATQPDLNVVARDVQHVQNELTDFKEEQAERWRDNRQTHADLYARLDRLPPWGSIALALLSALASGAMVAAIRF